MTGRTSQCVTVSNSLLLPKSDRIPPRPDACLRDVLLGGGAERKFTGVDIISLPFLLMEPARGEPALSDFLTLPVAEAKPPSPGSKARKRREN